jgi:aminodeoxyfutalosine deaminase
MPKQQHDQVPTFVWGIPHESMGLSGVNPYRLRYEINAGGKVASYGSRCLFTTGEEASAPSSSPVDTPTILLPGFVNAHTHLDLYSEHPIALNLGDDMVDWLLHVINTRHSSNTPLLNLERSIQELQACGTTTVGDITQQPTQVLHQLQQVGMVGNVAIEGFHAGAWQGVTSLFRHRGLIHQWRQAQTKVGGALHVGISPHSPYNVSLSAWQALCRMNPPFIHMHLAEFQGEEAFLEKRQGQERIQHLHQRILGRTFPPEGTWQAYLDAWPKNTLGLIAHATCLPEALLARFLEQHPKVFVVSCPRSNLHLHQHTLPTAIVNAFAERIVLGTDSRLSCPTLDVRDEWRTFAHHHGLRLSPQVALHGLTLRGYRALGIHEHHMPWVLWELPKPPSQQPTLTLDGAITLVLEGQARVRHILPS